VYPSLRGREGEEKISAYLAREKRERGTKVDPKELREGQRKIISDERTQECN